MINTYFKLYLNNWQLFYVATDLVTVLAFEVKLHLCFSFFVFVWVFVDVFTVNDFLYFIFQQIYCLNILRMPFKIKRKKVKCLINARQCSTFYILLYNHLYTLPIFGTPCLLRKQYQKLRGLFKLYPILCDDILYLYICIYTFYFYTVLEFVLRTIFRYY